MESPGLLFEISYQDDELLEIDVHASNGRFSGFARVYTSYEALAQLADDLHQFPATIADRCSFSAGFLEGYAFFSAEFFCINKSGHSAAKLRIDANIPTAEYWNTEQNKVELVMRFESEAARVFSEQLARMVESHSGRARLSAIGRWVN